MEELTEEDIASLLDSGWVFVTYNDPYFIDVFIKHIPEPDKKEYGKGWFIKKTEDFFNRLVSLGMDKGSAYYDSCVLIFFRRSKDGSQISINLFSLSKDGMLKDVARQIKKSGEIIG